MDNMRKAEKAMIAFLESRGFVVDFERQIWREPRDIRRYISSQPTPIMISGWTRANAYIRSEIQHWKEGDRKEPKPTPAVSCVMYCSEKDAFSKAKGRILSLSRVLRKMNLNRVFSAQRKSHDRKEVQAEAPPEG